MVLWRRYGIYVAGVALALVAGTAAWSGWRYYDTNQKLQAGDRFTQAMLAANQGQTDAAVTGFAEVASGGAAGYAVLSRMQAAALKVRAGDRAAAAGIYDGIAADAAVPETYRQAALLLSVMQSADAGDPKALSDRLAPLAADDNPWRHTARELQAVLAVRANEPDRARTILEALAKDAAAPQSLRTRAAELVRALGGGA
ncbi:membrane protein [Allostella vacuolata]|nr:membrane protein [Stella vacuolata]